MKTTLLTTIILSVTILNSYGQNIKEIEIKPIPAKDFNFCLSDCGECGKVIFTTHISDLEFESNMDYIKEVKVDKEGKKYIYSVVAEARPIQLFTIKGPEIVEYTLPINDLEVGRCQDYIINLISVPTPINTINISDPIKESNPIDTTPPPDIPQKSKTNPQDEPSGPDPRKIAEGEIAKKKAAQKVKKWEFKQFKKNDNVYKKHKNKQVFWLSSAIVSAGIGGYLKYTADQKYEEYIASTDPDEIQDLKETVQLYDKLTPAFFGLAGVCSIGFIVQTAKKSKRKNVLEVQFNGRSARLTYTF